MTDLRSDLEAAFKEAEGSTASSEAAPTDMGNASVDTAAGPTSDGTDTTESSAPGIEAATAAGRVRDSSGRFAPKTAGEPAKATQTAKAPEVAAAPSATPAPGGTLPLSSGAPPIATPSPAAAKAPQSWTPAEREHFAKAPPEVQAAVARVDREVRQVMQEAAPARRFQQEFQQAVAPFEPMIRAAGLDPIRAAQSAFTTIQQLQAGSAETKAQVVANLIRSYGVNIESLAAVLDTQPQQAQQAQVDPRSIAEQVRQQVMQSFQQQRSQQLQTKFEREVSGFLADPANEFAEDVLHEMAAFIDAAKARNVELPLKDAYDRAVWANPEMRAILQQREAAKSAVTAQAATQRATVAGSSVRNQPATAVNGTSGNSLRADIEAAIAQQNGR